MITNVDIRHTETFRILSFSEKFRRKYQSIYDVYIEPEEFIKLIVKNINELINVGGDADFWTIIFGYEGSGKSSFSLMLLSNLLKRRLDKILTNIIFLQNEYLKVVNYFLENEIKKEPLMIDDAHFVFGKYNFLTKETAFLLQFIRFIRDQQIIHILNTQTPTQLFDVVWLERTNNFIYCFREKVYDGDKLIGFNYLVASWQDSGKIKEIIETKKLRDVANYREILKNFPPDFLTITNSLFEKYSSEYFTYQKVKKFYKRFFTYFRLKGYIKASDYEKFLNFLYLLNEYLFYSEKEEKNILFNKIKNIYHNDEDIQKLITIYEETNDIFIENRLNNLIFNFRDVIKIRKPIFSSPIF